MEIPKFKNIDTQLALKYLGGNKKLYLKVLNQFYDQNKDLKLEKLNQEELQTTLHSLKGTSANLGATNLSLISKKLGKELDRKLFKQFYNELNKVLEELKTVKIDNN